MKYHSGRNIISSIIIEIHRRNDFAEESKILLDTDLKIILLLNNFYIYSFLLLKIILILNLTLKLIATSYNLKENGI